MSTGHPPRIAQKVISERSDKHKLSIGHGRAPSVASPREFQVTPIQSIGRGARTPTRKSLNTRGVSPETPTNSPCPLPETFAASGGRGSLANPVCSRQRGVATDVSALQPLVESPILWQSPQGPASVCQTQKPEAAACNYWGPLDDEARQFDRVVEDQVERIKSEAGWLYTEEQPDLVFERLLMMERRGKLGRLVQEEIAAIAGLRTAPTRTEEEQTGLDAGTVVREEWPRDAVLLEDEVPAVATEQRAVVDVEAERVVFPRVANPIQDLMRRRKSLGIASRPPVSGTESQAVILKLKRTCRDDASVPRPLDVAPKIPHRPTKTTKIPSKDLEIVPKACTAPSPRIRLWMRRMFAGMLFLAAILYVVGAWARFRM